MDFEKYFEETELWEEGRESFRALHARMSDAGFARSYCEAYEAYKAGDDAFAAYIKAFAERENVPVEVLNLYLYIRFSEYAYEEYKRRGISDEIFYATMHDFAITGHQNVDKGGVYGITQLPERPWLRLHLDCKLYWLGRLQFELIESAYDMEIDGHCIKKGDVCLNVHISRYRPLSEEECEQSYEYAREFFKKYYGIEKCVFFCHSWLLHPWLTEALPESSSIIRFQNKFHIFKTVENADDAISYVFMNKRENIADYPEDTSLQRKLKQYLLENRPVGIATGVRL